MTALSLMLLLCLAMSPVEARVETAVGPAPQPVTEASPLSIPAAGFQASSSRELPGASFAEATAAVVLHAGPSVNHAGTLSLSVGAVVRMGSPSSGSSEYVPVYIASGFPVYVHGDFVQVDKARRVVSVEGSRLNLRLLPATVGLPPVGQLGEGPHELQLLDIEGEWVRVLAPVSLPLYARNKNLEVRTPAQASERWFAELGSREGRRQTQIAAFEATDPTRLRDRRLEQRVQQMAEATLDTLNVGQLQDRDRQLDQLVREVRAVDRHDLVAEVSELQRQVTAEGVRRKAAVAAMLEAERVRAREAANLVREARALDFGLRFLGKGEARTVHGLVTRASSPDSESAVYSIEAKDGRLYKLSAAKDIADLKVLIGKRVELEGRSLTLVNVEGPVLIVDSVTRVSVP